LSRGPTRLQRVHASAPLPKFKIRFHAARRDRATTHEAIMGHQTLEGVGR